MQATPILEDVAAAQSFLTALGGTFRFRSFRDDKGAVDFGRKYNAFDHAKLARDNQQGRGIFVVVNEGGDDDRSINKVRAVFLDLDMKTFNDSAAFDTALLFACEGRRSQDEPIPSDWLKPSVVVNSGGGAHVYWLVDDFPVDQFRRVQHAISARFQGDPKVCNPSRVMRLPGSLHHKTDTPKPVQLVECSPHRYSATQLAEWLCISLEAPDPVESLGMNTRGSGRDLSADAIADVQSALKRLDRKNPDAVHDRTEWFRVIASLKAHAWPDEVMEPIARAWSAQSSKFDDVRWPVDWYSIKVDGGISPGTLYFMAGQVDEDCPPTGTSDGFACRFVRWLDGRAMFARGRWFAWSGSHWKPGGEQVASWLKQFAHEQWKHAHCEYGRSPGDGNLERKMKSAQKLYDQTVQQKVLAAAAVMLHVEANLLDRDDYLLACSNGTVDLRTGELKSADPEDRITLCTEVEFDSASQSPVWDAFIAEAIGDAATADWFQRFMGYCTTGDVRHELMLLTVGPGGTGKTTALKAVMHALGGEIAATSYATTAGSALLSDSGNRRNANEHTAGLTPLIGKRMAVVNEIKKGEAWDDALFKSLISREPIPMRESGGRATFNVTPTWKIWVRGNFPPNSRDTSHAFYRRVALIEFRRRPEQINDHLDEQLRREAKGILAYLVRGAVKWKEQGLAQSALMLKALEAYRSDQDVFGEWAGAALEKGGFTPGELLRDSYARYTGNTHRLSDKQFASAMRDQGYTAGQGRWRGEKARGFKVTLRPDLDEDIYNLV